MTDLRNPHSGDILFARDELKCPVTGEVKLEPSFAHVLVEVRLKFGVAMSVTSCCRSKAYNEQIGGHPNSLHVWDEPHHAVGGTCAIDIAIPNSSYRYGLLRAAQWWGMSVGIGSSFVHLDYRRAAGLEAAAFVYGR